MMRKQYVLITGATGFIGSHVTEKLLLDKSYCVIAVVRGDRDYKNVNELENKGVILVEGNFYDKNLIEKIFKKFPVRNVIHIAALRGLGAGTKKDYYKVNVIGTEALLDISLQHQIDKFIFCSSVGVFGTTPKELPANVRTQLNGDNVYHNTKILAEKRVKEFISKGLDAFIVRPTITYGEGDNGFPSTLIRMVRKRILLLPIRDNKIHLLDVSQLAELFLKILKTDNLGNRIIIAADEEPIVLRELVDLISYYYYEKKYPLILRVPSILFNVLLFLFQAIDNSKWNLSIQLLSKNWYFDTTEMNSFIEFRSENTKKRFLKYLQKLG
jgi:nucleoside-diphosphate-sugar epimerase